MTIECPNCQARYEVKLPPEGRTVRCARCKTVWRAMPIDEAAEVASEEGGREDNEQPGATGAHPDQASARNANGYADEQSANRVIYDHTAHGANEGVGPVPAFARGQSGEETSSIHPTSETAESSRHASSRLEDGGDTQMVRPSDLQSSIVPFRSTVSPFPNEFEMAAPSSELQTLEEARAAVRDVFSSLNDAVRPMNGSPYVEPVLPQSNEAPSARSRFSVFSTDPASQAVGVSDTEQLYSHSDTTIDDETSVRSASEPALDEDARDETVDHDSDANADLDEGEYRETESSASEDETDDEPSFSDRSDATETTQARQPEAQSLSGQEADAAIRAALTRHYTRDNLEPVLNQDFDLAQQLEAQLKAKPMRREEDGGAVSELQSRPAFPLDSLSEDALVDEDREAPDEAGDQTRIDEGLLQQLQKTKAQANDRRQGGGLLLAAAWGLFLSVAAGLIGGAFAFRDMAAEALPGLAPVYRSLGMPITVQPLSFDNIRYEWSPTTVRPTLVISGTVVNKANRKVKTPDFYLTVKDQDPQLDREYSIALPVDGGKIRARQQADFQIELVSPNPSITAVELELRNVE